MIWIGIWTYLLALFSAADAITTTEAISHGAREFNPFIVPVVDHIFLVKYGFVIVAICMALWTEHKYRGDGWTIPASATCVTVLPVVSNVMTFIREGWWM